MSDMVLVFDHITCIIHYQPVTANWK